MGTERSGNSRSYNPGIGTAIIAGVDSALRHALKYNAFGAAYVQNIILQRRAARGQARPQPVILSKKPEWMDVTVEETDLGLYDRLFDDEEGDQS